MAARKIQAKPDRPAKVKPRARVKNTKPRQGKPRPNFPGFAEVQVRVGCFTVAP